MLPTRRPLAPLVALLLLAAGCRDSFSPASTTVDYSLSRSKWSQAAFHDYSFTLQHICFCVVTEPVRVTVQHDVVVSASSIATGKPIDTRYIPSIDALFDYIAQGITSHMARMDASYDATYGFPVRVDYDGSVQIADDEGSYLVSELYPTAWVTNDRLTALRLPRQPAAGQPLR